MSNEHEHDCNCGCEHEEEAIVTLTLDDDSTLDCVVLAIYPAGDKEYIALLPTDSEDDGEVLLYRFKELENGEIQLDNIEEDDEYEIAADAFDELLDEAEFEEMGSDEEEKED
ncbi:MAG: DUF1292 domain-containing protein [Lachnospiraceae bacterium]|nr:DUF1292 domain-containing protein [Lachnospiraceae bacterium]